MIKDFSVKDFQKICGTFVHTFNGEPWNDKWTNERAQVYLQDFIENKRFIGYTAWDGGILAGAVFAHVRAFYSGDEIFIDELFVSPSHQRKGYGMALMDAVEKFAKESGCVNVTLFTGRGKPSFNFYGKRGYRSLDSLAFMYKHI